MFFIESGRTRMIKKKNSGFPFPAVSIFLAGVWSINVFAVPAPELIKSLPQSAGGTTSTGTFCRKPASTRSFRTG